MPRPNKRTLACRRASTIGRAKRLRKDGAASILVPAAPKTTDTTNKEKERGGSSARGDGNDAEEEGGEDDQNQEGRNQEEEQERNELEVHGESGGAELYASFSPITYRPTPTQTHTPVPVPTPPPLAFSAAPVAPVAPVVPIGPSENPPSEAQIGTAENGVEQSQEPTTTTAPFTPGNPLNKPIPIPSSSAAAVAKTPCRQTLWRRRKRAEAAAAAATAAATASEHAAPPNPDIPPTMTLTHAQELSTAVARWPRAVPQDIKREILLAAANDMEKLLKSKTLTPTGQDLVRHQQVLQFINAQLKNSRGAPRMEIAELVASTYRKGRDVAERIVKTEKEWVKNRVVPSGKQGRTAKVPSMIEDQPTRRVVEQYIERALHEEGISSQGLVKAVTDYWQSLDSQDLIRNRIQDEEDEDDEDQTEAPAQGTSAPKKLSITTKTATRWLQVMGYTFKDGKYHLKGEAVIKTPRSVENQARQQQQQIQQQIQHEQQMHAQAHAPQISQHPSQPGAFVPFPQYSPLSGSPSALPPPGQLPPSRELSGFGWQRQD